MNSDRELAFEHSRQINIAVSAMAVSLALIGLTSATLTVAWLAGFLGISTAAASQVATAIEVGGWALTAVSVLFAGGLGGAVWATVRAMAKKKTRAVFIA